MQIMEVKQQKQQRQQYKNKLSMIDRYSIHCSLRMEPSCECYSSTTISEACRECGIKDIPSGFLCPIMMEVMIVPVVSIYGHTYENEAILRWIDEKGTCPCTRRPLRRDDIAPDSKIQEKIEKWLWMNGLPNIPKMYAQQQQAEQQLSQKSPDARLPSHVMSNLGQPLSILDIMLMVH